MKKGLIISIFGLVLVGSFVMADSFNEVISNWGLFYDNVTIGNGSQTISMNGSTGDITTIGNIDALGNITANNFFTYTGEVQGLISIKSDVSTNLLTIGNSTDNTIVADVYGNISADYFIGDGSLLTGLSSSYEHPDYITLNHSGIVTGDYPLVLNKNPTVSSGFSNSHLSALDINNEVTLTGSPFAFNTMSGIDISVDTTYSSFTGTNGIIADGIRLQVAMDDQLLPALHSDADGLDVAISRSSSNNVFGAFTKANQVGTGSAYGYQGYGSNTGSSTGLNAIGVYGFASSTNGLEAGILASSFGTGSSDFSFYGAQGNFYMKSGNMYIWENKNIQTVTNTAHISQSEDGSLFVENNLQVNDTSFISVPYAEVYNVTMNGYTLTIPSLNTWYNFTGLLQGETKGFTINNNVLTASHSGIYKVDYSVSFSGGGGSTHAIGLLINGVEHSPCRIYRKLGTAGDVGNAGGTCLITLNAGDKVSGAVQDVLTPAQNIDVWSVNANIIRVGN